MVQLVPLRVRDGMCVGVALTLPRTTLLVAVAPRGYVMCGLLDVERLDELHPERGIVAARVSGVRSPEDILVSRVDAVTAGARALGVVEGMTGADALGLML